MNHACWVCPLDFKLESLFQSSVKMQKPLTPLGFKLVSLLPLARNATAATWRVPAFIGI
jgi:hypothetical protein